MDELSYDRFNENAKHIVRVNLSAKMGDELIDESSVMAPVAQTFKNEFPEVKATTRLLKTADIAKVIYKNQTFRSGKSAMVDSTFFDVFSIKFNILLLLPVPLEPIIKILEFLSIKCCLNPFGVSFFLF
jgi:putative ABC transport system permease protein